MQGGSSMKSSKRAWDNCFFGITSVIRRKFLHNTRIVIPNKCEESRNWLIFQEIAASFTLLAMTKNQLFKQFSAAQGKNSGISRL
jgi:hypothetical protein